MKTIAEIDREINRLEEELAEIKGRPTEVYSRIVGYYRSLRNWNRGKREEYSHRMVFEWNSTELNAAGSRSAGLSPADSRSENLTAAGRSAFAVPAPETAVSEQTGQTPVEYIYFYRETCPNCPAVRSLLSRIDLPGVELDIDTDEGMEAAVEHGIYAAPTVIFVDNEKNEIYRASTVEQLNAQIPQIA